MGDISTEHIALIGFAARLGTCVSHEDGIAHELDLQSEAQLLMNLLASNPSTETVIKESLDVAVRPFFDPEPSSTMILPESSSSHCSNSTGTSNSQTTKEAYKSSGAFSFSCPSLSLDGKSPPPLRSRLPSDDSSYSDNSTLSSQPAPIVSMGRPLVVDDRDALRLSADSMARNILRTFQKAVKWRKQCWIDTLARPLVDEERMMKKAGATDEELKELLETPVARVISSLNQTSIEVLDARTSFRVLPQRWEKNNNNESEDDVVPPTKKRKIVIDSNNNNATTEEEEWTTTHVLSFQTVLNLSSPAGYSQVTLDAPGVMEGTFTTSGKSVVLAGVSVEVDTRVLAAMIEKSSRIIARASAEVFMNPYPEFTDAETGASLMASPHPTTTAAMMPTEPARRLSSSSNNEVDMSLMAPTIITPRMKSPSPSAYFDDDDTDLELAGKACIPLPDDLSAANHKRAILRMVSPQPGSSSNSSVDSIPSLRIASSNKKRRSSGPSLVSPPLSNSAEYLSFDDKTGPSLPALLEVACAEMRAH